MNFELAARIHIRILMLPLCDTRRRRLSFPRDPGAFAFSIICGFFNAFSIASFNLNGNRGYRHATFLRDYGKAQQWLIYALKKTLATRVAHKFSGTWLLISVYSLIRRYERPALSQRIEKRNAWLALLAIRRADVKWTWTQSVKCAKWLEPFPPFNSWTEPYRQHGSHSLLSLPFFSCGISALQRERSARERKRTTWMERWKKKARDWSGWGKWVARGGS